MNLIFWGSDKFLQSLLRALFDCKHVRKVEEYVGERALVVAQIWLQNATGES